MITFQEALGQLSALVSAGKPYSAADLFKIAGQVTTDAAEGMAQGSVTLLYSGDINGARSASIIDEMIAQGADIRVVDKTQAAAFLNSDEFKIAFNAVATDADRALMTSATSGPWAQLSTRFVKETVGVVRFLGPEADIARTFGATELTSILRDATTKVTSIEGIPIADLKALGEQGAFLKIKASSIASVGGGAFEVISNGSGGVSFLKIGAFLNPEITHTLEYVKAHPEAVQSMADYVGKLASAEKTALTTFLHGASKVAGPSDDEGVGGNADRIVFDTGIGTQDVQFVRSGSDLILKIDGTADQVQVLNYFMSGDAWAVEEICFADAPGTVVGISEVNAVIAAGGFIS